MWLIGFRIVVVVLGMPRQPRIEFEGACYHVINRGNYRAHVFKSDGAKQALLKTLGETAQKLGWKVHAWVIMTNHFHVALETPPGNLVEGMKLWQGSFATRCNRLRKEQGPIRPLQKHAGGLGFLSRDLVPLP